MVAKIDQIGLLTGAPQAATQQKVGSTNRTLLTPIQPRCSAFGRELRLRAVDIFILDELRLDSASKFYPSIHQNSSNNVVTDYL